MLGITLLSIRLYGRCRCVDVKKYLILTPIVFGPKTRILSSLSIDALNIMSFFSELKNTIKANLTGTTLSDDSDLVRVISKELSNALKEKFEGGAPIESSSYSSPKPMRQIMLQGDNMDRFVNEIELRVKKQIRLELDRGKVRRIIFKAIEWTITLIAGGIVKILFQKYLQ